MSHVIEDTQTESGVRMVSMTPEVKKCFKRNLYDRKKPKIEPVVDGYRGFLFLDKNGRTMVDLRWEKVFSTCMNKFVKYVKNIQYIIASAKLKNYNNFE
jgi:hypothetical protein